MAEGDTRESLIAAHSAGLDVAGLRAGAAAMARFGGKLNKEQAPAMFAWLDGDRRDPEPWFDVFLTDDRTERKRWPVKAVQENAPDATAALLAVLVPGPLDLIGGRGRTPKKARGEGQHIAPIPAKTRS